MMFQMTKIITLKLNDLLCNRLSEEKTHWKGRKQMLVDIHICKSWLKGTFVDLIKVFLLKDYFLYLVILVEMLRLDPDTLDEVLFLHCFLMEKDVPMKKWRCI